MISITNPVDLSLKADLDVNTGKVPAEQLPSYVDDVLEYADLASFPGTGTAGVIYVAVNNGKVYRWSGSAYVEISPAPATTDALAEGSTNLYFSSARAKAAVPTSLVIAASDETTAITAGTAKVTFRMPYAMTVTAVRASLSTAQASGNIFTVDINDNGTSILGTKLTIDNTEKTSVTAATAATITDASLADDAEITIDVDQIGNGTAKGLKVTLIGNVA
jgi:hypothetical protein